MGLGPNIPSEIQGNSLVIFRNTARQHHGYESQGTIIQLRFREKRLSRLYNMYG